MRVLSLFSGIGAHDLGLEWAGMEIVGQVEIDDYCTAILEKHFPGVRRWRDIAAVTDDDLSSLDADLVTGGFPCQDISQAGKKQGIDGARSGLWWEMRRVIATVKPTWVLIENVPALRNRGGDEVLSSLEALNYDAWPLVVGAVHAGAPHRRQRALIVAHSNDDGRKRQRTNRSNQERQDARRHNIDRCGSEAAMGDPNGAGQPDLSRRAQTHQRWPEPPGRHQAAWEHPRAIESSVGRATYGATRAMALKALGNSNPPQLFAMVGRAIMEADRVSSKVEETK